MGKIKRKQFYGPTPLKWRKLGDALLAVSTLITTYAIADDLKWIAISALVLGVIGKFLTNFFSVEEVQPEVFNNKTIHPDRDNDPTDLV